jgi:hypothetical protein
MSTGKHAVFAQHIEHLGKHSTIRNPEHRKLLMVFCNSSSGITITEAANVQHIHIFGIYEDVWHFSQSPTMSYQQSQQPADASH